MIDVKLCKGGDTTSAVGKTSLAKGSNDRLEQRQSSNVAPQKLGLARVKMPTTKRCNEHQIAYRAFASLFVAAGHATFLNNAHA